MQLPNPTFRLLTSLILRPRPGLPSKRVFQFLANVFFNSLNLTKFTSNPEKFSIFQIYRLLSVHSGKLGYINFFTTLAMCYGPLPFFLILPFRKK